MHGDTDPIRGGLGNRSVAKLEDFARRADPVKAKRAHGPRRAAHASMLVAGAWTHHAWRSRFHALSSTRMLLRPSTADDVLSATLSTLRLAAVGTSPIDASGRWAKALPAAPVLRLHIVMSGQCWLTVDGDRTKYHLRSGDCFLVPQPRRLVLAGDPSLKTPVPLRRAVRSTEDGVVGIVCTAPGEFFAAGSAFQLEGHFQDIVFGRLPPVIHIPALADQAAVLRWGLERYATEVRTAQPGRALKLQHLAPSMLLQTNRSYLASDSYTHIRA